MTDELTAAKEYLTSLGVPDTYEDGTHATLTARISHAILNEVRAHSRDNMALLIIRAAEAEAKGLCAPGTLEQVAWQVALEVQQEIKRGRQVEGLTGVPDIPLVVPFKVDEK